MKKLLSLVAGMAFVLACGLAYAEDSMMMPTYPSDKMIGNDDLLHNDLDKDRSTVNQMPEGFGAGGSGAGGVLKGPDSWKNDTAPSQPPVDNMAPAPIDKMTPGSDTKGPGGGDTDKDQGGYSY